MIDISAWTTFGVPALCADYLAIEQISTIQRSLFQAPFYLLGGGSNLLFTRPYAGRILHMRLRGIKIIDRRDGWTWLRVAAGEPWQNAVDFSIAQGLSGLENLTGIPGSTGAAPVQNIGAYGRELADVLDSVIVYDILEDCWRRLYRPDLHLAYRDSVFKRNPGRYCITEVIFKLNNAPSLADFCIDYAPLKAVFAQPDAPAINALNIAAAVLKIRKQKLPDPAVVGNAGSFFKNPILDVSVWRQLLQREPAMPWFAQDDGLTYKIPAAWLIEQIGYKGWTVEGRYGVYPLQPLVLVRYTHATGAEIAQLAAEIIAKVEQRFGIRLEPEVQYI